MATPVAPVSDSLGGGVVGIPWRQQLEWNQDRTMTVRNFGAYSLAALLRARQPDNLDYRTAAEWLNAMARAVNCRKREAQTAI